MSCLTSRLKGRIAGPLTIHFVDRSLVRNRLTSGLFILALLSAENVVSQESTQLQENVLKITPNKCIALKKGQICYQSLRIQFTPATTSEFCLKVSNQSEPLECWSGNEPVEFQYRFASRTDLTFEFIDMRKQIMASATFDVAWVYKHSRKRNRWRLF